MPDPAQKLDHPHIVSHPDYCGGNPVIAGTKFPVRSVVNYVLRQDLTAEELVREFGHLMLARVHDALSYYYDHQNEVERELAENSEQRLMGG